MTYWLTKESYMLAACQNALEVSEVTGTLVGQPSPSLSNEIVERCLAGKDAIEEKEWDTDPVVVSLSIVLFHINNYNGYR